MFPINFLDEIADRYELTSKQRKVFRERFSRKTTESGIARILSLSNSRVSGIMTEIYEKFGFTAKGSGKYGYLLELLIIEFNKFQLKIDSQAVSTNNTNTENIKDIKVVDHSNLISSAEYRWVYIPELERDSGQTRCITFSFDGQLIVAADDDSDIRLWRENSTTRIPISFDGLTGSVHSVDITPDCRIVISAGKRGTVEAWRITNTGGSQLFSCSTESSRTIVKIHPNGDIFLASVYSQIQVWGIYSRELLHTLKIGASIYSIDVSSDGSLLAVGCYNEIQVWNLSNFKRMNKHKENHGVHEGIVHAIAINPDGETIVSGGSDGTVKVWDIIGGKCLYTLQGHSESVTSVVINSDNRTIASGSGDGTIRLWDLSTGLHLSTLTAFPYTVNCLAFSPDGQTLIAGSCISRVIKSWKRVQATALPNQE